MFGNHRTRLTVVGSSNARSATRSWLSASSRANASHSHRITTTAAPACSSVGKGDMGGAGGGKAAGRRRRTGWIGGAGASNAGLRVRHMRPRAAAGKQKNAGGAGAGGTARLTSTSTDRGTSMCSCLPRRGERSEETGQRRAAGCRTAAPWSLCKQASGAGMADRCGSGLLEQASERALHGARHTGLAVNPERSAVTG